MRLQDRQEGQPEATHGQGYLPEEKEVKTRKEVAALFTAQAQVLALPCGILCHAGTTYELMTFSLISYIA